MSLKARIQSGMNQGTGTTQWTASQAFFIRTNAVGRFQSDFDTGAFAPAYFHQRNNDGTVDTIKLEPNFSNYLVMQGKGAKDFAAGRI